MQQQQQMKNWILILMIMTISYMVHQKMNTNTSRKKPSVVSTASFVNFRN